MACSSGVFLMIADARLISVGLGGADALLTGRTDCLSGDVEGKVGPRFTSFEALLFDGGRESCLWGTAKASSAAFPASVFETTGELELSKSNATPFSCNIENWSSVGNRDDSSSPLFTLALASSAAKGSPSVTAAGDRFGF